MSNILNDKIAITSAIYIKLFPHKRSRHIVNSDAQISWKPHKCWYKSETVRKHDRPGAHRQSIDINRIYRRIIARYMAHWLGIIQLNNTIVQLLCNSGATNFCTMAEWQCQSPFLFPVVTTVKWQVLPFPLQILLRGY